MKKNIIKILLAVSAVTAPLAARADLIWHEGFHYPNGDLTNASSGVWINFSGSQDMLVNNSNLEVSTTGNAISSRSGDYRRPLATVAASPYTNTVQVLYASFTVICTNLPNGAGSYFASFYNPKSGTGGGYFGRIQAFTNGTVVPNTWRLGVTANTLSANPANGGYPVDLALNTPYRIVEELDPTSSGLQAATIWINPLDVNQTGLSPTETHYTSGAGSDSIGAAATIPVTDYSFRQASSFGNGFWVITNLALATTFAEAATNVLNTNAVSPIIVYNPVGTTNFPGAAITLAALANGQGLGNMTYRWQQGGTNYTSNPANANVLSIPSAQISDSGDFTLIATTPYGLSVTSSVAKVKIFDGPFPPSFVTQPASATIYKGQSATLTTTVIGPLGGGPVSYTWYSNNVVVTAGQSDNGHSSSYVFNNAPTNYSAAYKVAVTNSFGGLVSSNATLSVLPVPTVSIAYLRTLVDPTTYQPTNSPATIPYHVTGVVTTFTNSSSGNTASYFLQDATAGINIFATFGSAFRPAPGDVVSFTGVLSYFSTTGLELYADDIDTDPGSPYPYTTYNDTGTSNALPTPIKIPFTVTNDYGLRYVNTNLAGSLVTLTNVYFGDSAGTTISTSGNSAVNVTNASGQNFNVQFFGPNMDTAGQTLPAFAYSVTGVLYGGNPNFSVAVTRFADIVTTPPPSPIPLSLNYSGGNLTFNWADSSFNLQAATNVTGPYITIPGASSGFMTNTTSGSRMFFRLYRP